MIFPYIISSSLKDLSLKNLKVFQNLINKSRILLKETSSDSKPQVKYVPPWKWQYKNIFLKNIFYINLGVFVTNLNLYQSAMLERVKKFEL